MNASGAQIGTARSTAQTAVAICATGDARERA